MGSTIKGKNLLLQEQILFSDSLFQLIREPKMRWQNCFNESVLIHCKNDNLRPSSNKFCD